MSNFNFDKIYNFNDNFELKKGSQDLYVNYSNGTVIKTQSVMTQIIDMCDGKISMNKIFNNLSSIYGIDATMLKQNCEESLKRSYETQLIYDDQLVEFFEGIPLKKYSDINTIWVHLSSRCNLRCPFCYSNSGNHEANTLDINKLKLFLDSVDNKDKMEIIISGGEPFMYPNLLEFLEYLKESKYNSTYVITNGTCGHELYEKAIPLIDKIQFSIDGLLEETNSKTRGKGSLEKTINGVKLAKKIGCNNIIISTLPNKYNVEQLKDFPNFVSSLGADSFHLPRFMPVGRGNDSLDLSPDSKILRQNLKEMYKSVYKLNISKDKYLHISMASDWYSKIKECKKRVSCGACTGLISVNYDGNIYPCASLHKKEFYLGSIDNKYLDLSDNMEKMAKYLSVENEESYCYKCKYKYFCGGNCKAIAYSYGNIVGKTDECEEIPKIIESIFNKI